MKVFFDTNVLVSAFTSRGLCLNLLERVALDHEHEVVTSERVLDELHRVLSGKFGASAEEADRAIRIMRRGEVIADGGPSPAIPNLRDPDDRPILAAAMAAGAEVLVTGDGDLLEVAGAVTSPRIVDPRALWEMLKEST